MEEYRDRVSAIERRLAEGQPINREEILFLLLAWLVSSRTRQDMKYDLP